MNTAFDQKKIAAVLAEQGLPAQVRSLVRKYYLPLARWCARQPKIDGKPLLFGISGAQGTGKSTLANILKLVLETDHGWRVAVLSLDDFYLTRAERQRLAAERHPLLRTRGVPGTHDLSMLKNWLGKLQKLGSEETLRLPLFDKANDDRAATEDWPAVAGPLDAILLEGWCIGSRPQPEAALARPVNALERDKDPSGEWRRFVNGQLAGPYAQAFSRLDRLIYLQAPGFGAVYRWRLEQERKLAARTKGPSTAVMSNAEVAEFLQYFERITRADFDALPQQADAVLQLDEQHGARRLTFR